MVIHHKDNMKCNNSPDNLEKLLQSEHMKAHEKNIEKLVKYSKSSIGRETSRSSMVNSWKNGSINKDVFVNMWKNKHIRLKRIESLSLQTNNVLITFVGKALKELGSSCREYEVRNWLNNNKEVQEYLRYMNPDFKNGANDRLNKMQFLYALRKNNFKNLRAVKDFYVLLKAPFDKIVEYCNLNKPKTSKNSHPVVKPDIDNFFKLLCDACNGVIWKDDSQICLAVVGKKYYPAPFEGISLSVDDLD